MEDVLVSTIMQCGILVGIPWLFYLIFERQKNGFFSWVGLYRPADRRWIKSAVVVFIIAIIVMAGSLQWFINFGGLSKELLYSLDLGSKVLTVELVLIVLIKAIVQTSLSEEVFFRGFIGKRVQKKFGYLAGTLTQAILFGLPHGLPFVLVYKAYAFGITFFLAATIVGYMQFWLNEKRGHGSIIPSIIVHATMNVISFM